MSAVTSITIDQFGVKTLISQGDEFMVYHQSPQMRPQKHFCKRIDVNRKRVEVLTNNATLTWPTTSIVWREQEAA
jgi:hypothetical protein